MDARPEPSTLLFDIWAIANATRAALNRVLAPSGLSADEFALYSFLCDPGGRSPGELAAMLRLPPTTVSSIVRRLDQRGHIERLAVEADRRSYRIVLSTEGRAVHAAAGEAFVPFLAAVEARLGTHAASTRRALTRLDQVLAELLATDAAD